MSGPPIARFIEIEQAELGHIHLQFSSKQFFEIRIHRTNIVKEIDVGILFGKAVQCRQSLQIL